MDDRKRSESIFSFSPDLEAYHHARLVKHARHARPTGCAWLRAASRSLRDPLTHSARGGVLELSGRGTSIFYALPLAGRTRNHVDKERDNLERVAFLFQSIVLPRRQKWYSRGL